MPLQNLGMTDWKGSKNNNLLELNGMTTQIYLDEGAPDSERFKIVTGSNGAGGIAVSADGIHWGEVKDLQTDAMILALNVKSEQIALANHLESAADGAKAAGNALLSAVNGSIRGAFAAPAAVQPPPPPVAEIVAHVELDDKLDESLPPTDEPAKVWLEVE